jgi:hypothetical protein
MRSQHFKILTEYFDSQLPQIDSAFRFPAPPLIGENEGIVRNIVQERKKGRVIKTRAPMQEDQGMFGFRLAVTLNLVVDISPVDGKVPSTDFNGTANPGQENRDGSA